MEKLIDISHCIEDGMPVYPGDMETRLSKAKELTVDGYNDHRLEIGMHSGTHMDSPMHLTNCSKYISEYPLDSFIGEGCILDVRGQELIENRPLYNEIIHENNIVLLHTGYDRFYGTETYYINHPCVSSEFCKMIIDRKVKILGIDCPSIDRYPFEYHKLLFENGIFILENLTNLEKLLELGDFEVISLPLAIKADSSMTRAIVRVL
jgi:Predicted metal-dependent hydrolase